MALTSLCAALSNGPCAGVALAGTYQVVVTGTFVSTSAAYADGLARGCLVLIQTSPDGGTTWVNVDRGSLSSAGSLTVTLGTGAQLRANVVNGATGVSINVDYGVVP